MKRWRRSELAELFNCSEATVDRMRRRGEFAACRFQRRTGMSQTASLKTSRNGKLYPWLSVAAINWQNIGMVKSKSHGEGCIDVAQSTGRLRFRIRGARPINQRKKESKKAFRKWDLIQVTLSEAKQRAMGRMHPELKKQLLQRKGG